VSTSRQALGVAGGGIVLEQYAAGLEHLNQRGQHLVLVSLHGGGGELYDQDVEETVDHQPRQQIGVAIHQAVAGLVEQALAQAQGDVDAVHQQGFVQHVLDVA
jgi:hypothetical protein